MAVSIDFRLSTDRPCGAGPMVVGSPSLPTTLMTMRNCFHFLETLFLITILNNKYKYAKHTIYIYEVNS